MAPGSAPSATSDAQARASSAQRFRRSVLYWLNSAVAPQLGDAWGIHEGHPLTRHRWVMCKHDHRGPVELKQPVDVLARGERDVVVAFRGWSIRRSRLRGVWPAHPAREG